MPRTAARPTADEWAFLNAICATPFDIVPRLVFADWQDEHDNPAFATALRTEGFPDDRGGWPAEFLDQLGGWLGYGFPRNQRIVFGSAGAADLVAEKEDGPAGDRGFVTALVSHGCVEQFACTLRFWKRHGPGLVMHQPVVRLNILDRRPAVRDDSACTWLRHAGRSMSGLPPWLFDELPDRLGYWLSSVRRTRFFATVREANEALSVAAINHARGHAMLPPIDPPLPTDS